MPRWSTSSCQSPAGFVTGDGQYMVVGQGDYPQGEVVVIDPARKETKCSIKGFKSRIRALALWPARCSFVVRSDLGPITEWDLAEKKEVRDIREDPLGPPILCCSNSRRISALRSPSPSGCGTH